MFAEKLVVRIGHEDSLLGRYRWRRFRLLTLIDARNPSYDATHGQHALVVGKKNLTYARTTIEPTLQDRQVLGDFERAFAFRCGHTRQRLLDARFHRLR